MYTEILSKIKSLNSKSHSMFTHFPEHKGSTQSSLKWNLLWNEVFSEMKSPLKLMIIFELFEGVVVFELFVRPTFNFPDRP